MLVWTFVCILICAGISLQCEDLGEPGECRYMLRKKDNRCDKLSKAELAKCYLTCEVCDPTTETVESNKNPPVWAQAPPTLRTPPGRRKKQEKMDTEDPTSLPLYAVIIMIIAVLVIFVGVTVCVFKLRKKWKKRKMKKNRKMLRNAPLRENTLQPNYLWAAGASHNSGFDYGMPTMDAWSRNLYLPVDETTRYPQHEALNNGFPAPGAAPNKNINIVTDRTRDKRRAPEPPSESTYQNLQSNGMKYIAPVEPKAAVPTAYPQVSSTDGANPDTLRTQNDSGVSQSPAKAPKAVISQELEEIHKSNATIQKSAPPPLPSRDHNNVREEPKTERMQGIEKAPTNDRLSQKNTFHENEMESKLDGEYEDRESDSSTVGLSRATSITTENTLHTAPGLANILNEWKEHLLEQKLELEEYYISLARYVKCLGLKPVTESKQHHDHAMKEWLRSNHSEKVPVQTIEQPYASVPENYAQIKFPEPPESVRGDFTWEPNDVNSQKQVIEGLKKKLVRIQNLLESTQEAAASGRKSFEDGNSNQIHLESESSVVDGLFRDDAGRITIKTLIHRLEQRERVKVQMRIAQALDAAKKRGGMDIASRDGPITCLSKQIHHVMTDILDPRTCTKIVLGAQASFTLANKLIRSIHANLLPVLRRRETKESVSKTVDRVILLTKQLLDMSKQLIARETSFRSKDYEVFVNAFVDTAQKIMDTTFHLVCVIVDLQRAERSGIVQHPPFAQSMRMPDTNKPHRLQSKTSDQQFGPSKNKLLSRLHSDSNATSLSVADVRQLNDDLAKLRKLLKSDRKLTTVDSPPPYEELQEGRTPMYDQCTQDGECDTTSIISCSTCMSHENQSCSGDSDATPPITQSLHVDTPPPANAEYPAGVQGDMVFRPSTRPSNHSKTLTTEKSEKRDSDPVKKAEYEQRLKDEIFKRTLDPSSFLPSHFGKDNINDIQPRHQAMLGRYFGNDVQSPKAQQKKAEESVDDFLPGKCLIADATTFAFHVAEEKGEVPTVTMLPCGIVANDTPPMTHLPKQRRVKMPKIPTITVVRNGAEDIPEDNRPVDDYPSSLSSRHLDDERDNCVQNTQEKTSHHDLDAEYSYSDTLPMNDRARQKYITSDNEYDVQGLSEETTGYCESLEKKEESIDGGEIRFVDGAAGDEIVPPYDSVSSSFGDAEYHDDIQDISDASSKRPSISPSLTAAHETSHKSFSDCDTKLDASLDFTTQPPTTDLTQSHDLIATQSGSVCSDDDTSVTKEQTEYSEDNAQLSDEDKKSVSRKSSLSGQEATKSPGTQSLAEDYTEEIHADAAKIKDTILDGDTALETDGSGVYDNTADSDTDRVVY